MSYLISLTCASCSFLYRYITTPTTSTTMMLMISSIKQSIYLEIHNREQAENAKHLQASLLKAERDLEELRNEIVKVRRVG